MLLNEVQTAQAAFFWREYKASEQVTNRLTASNYRSV